MEGALVVRLTEEERYLAKQVTLQRILHNMLDGSYRPTIKSNHGISTEIYSMGAEIAFCKLVNAYPDTATNRRRSFDVVLPDGTTIDVKHTEKPDGPLTVKENYMKPAPDLYALMVGTWPEYRYAGYVPSGAILRQECFDRTIRKPGYVWPQAELIRELPKGKEVVA